MFRLARFGIAGLVLWVLVLSALLLTTPAFGAGKKAEDSALPRNLTGTVFDQDSRAVSGAVVYLKNTRNLAILTFITGEDGSYRFNNLSPDIDYQVYAQANGHKSETKSLSSYDAHKQAHIDIKLGK